MSFSLFADAGELSFQPEHVFETQPRARAAS
jgi:hypothetical protein